MLIINVKEAGSLEKALKTYKWKYRKSGVMKQIRDGQEFTKKSVKRRKEVQKATYKQKKFNHIK